MYPHQLDRLSEALERAGLEALVATTPENLAYVTGFVSPMQRMHRGVECFGVFSRAGTALVVPSIEAGTLAADPADVDHVRCHGRSMFASAEASGGAADTVAGRVEAWTANPSATAADALADALTALGVASGRVGIDEAGLSPTGWGRLVERLGPARVTDATAHLATARMVKGPYEIECLQRALGIAEEAVNAVVQVLAPGTSEREAVRLFETEVAQRGATPRWAVITFGKRTALPVAPPSEATLHPGDLVRFDVGCLWRGACAALGRSAVMGEPDPRQEAWARAVTAGVEAAIDAIRPGAGAAAVFEAAVAAAREAGIPHFARHHVGHGIGLEPIEPPLLAAESEATLEAGTVLRIEAPYYEPGWGGIQSRETVLVSRGGCVGMNRSARGLVVLD